MLRRFENKEIAQDCSFTLSNFSFQMSDSSDFIIIPKLLSLDNSYEVL